MGSNLHVQAHQEEEPWQECSREALTPPTRLAHDGG
jgi:hypothetical protein